MCGWCASVRESCVCSCVHGVMWERGAVVCVGGVCFSEGKLCVYSCVHGVMWEKVCFSEGELCV